MFKHFINRGRNPRQRIAGRLCALVVCCTIPEANTVCEVSDTVVPMVDPAEAGERLRAVLTRHCFECHSGIEPKGKLNLERLSTDFADRRVEEQWLAAVKRVQSGEMPPESKPRPPVEDVQALADWVGAKVQAAMLARRGSEGRVVLRRLNRIEYQNTICDLVFFSSNLGNASNHSTKNLPVLFAGGGFFQHGHAYGIGSWIDMPAYSAPNRVMLKVVAVLKGTMP